MIIDNLDGIQPITDITEQCVREGKPDEIEPGVLTNGIPEFEKFRKSRG